MSLCDRSERPVSSSTETICPPPRKYIPSTCITVKPTMKPSSSRNGCSPTCARLSPPYRESSTEVGTLRFRSSSRRAYGAGLQRDASPRGRRRGAAAQGHRSARPSSDRQRERSGARPVSAALLTPGFIRTRPPRRSGDSQTQALLRILGARGVAAADRLPTPAALAHGPRTSRPGYVAAPRTLCGGEAGRGRCPARPHRDRGTVGRFRCGG